jgi:putative membrane protein
MPILINLLLSAIAVGIAAYLIPGVTVDGYVTAIVVAVVLAIVNSTIGPLLKILTLPLNILTLGIVSIIINVLMILLVARLVPGFTISGFWIALIFALVLALVNMVLWVWNKTWIYSD